MQIEVVGNDSQSLINLVSIFPELEDTALKFVDEPTFESDVTLMAMVLSFDITPRAKSLLKHLPTMVKGAIFFILSGVA
jgi:hypothetical protein